MKFKLTSVLFFLGLFNMHSQTQTWDTMYYKKYPNKLIVSFFQSYRNYEVDISQKLLSDTIGLSDVNYTAESNIISGLEFNYDKINFSFAYKSVPPLNQAQKGNTKYKNFNLNFGGNKWNIENSYRSYTGFFNKNTALYDTSFKTTGIYTQMPNLSIQTYKTKFLYFTNHNRFSFKSGYACSQRQLKSAFSFVLSANIYYNRLKNDSSFLPLPTRQFYDHYQTVNGLNVIAFSAYGGGSLNIVLWKALFANVTFLIGPEQQWRTYNYAESNITRKLSYISFSTDFRASIGANFKRFFVLFTSRVDASFYPSNAVDYETRFISGNFSLGYRFKVKTPKFYSKFQETKWYKKL